MNIKKFKTGCFNAFKFIVFISIFLFITNYIGNQLLTSAPIINMNMRCKWNDFYNLKKNSLDVVYVGSSHAYFGFDPNYVDNKMHINSFNMGTPLQKPVESYYVLKEILKTQHPKVIVFDVFWNIFNNETYFNIKTANFDLMKPSLNKLEFLLNVFDKGQYLPATSYAVRYHSMLQRFIDNELTIQDKALLSKKVNKDIIIRPKEYLGKGFVMNNHSLNKKSIKEILEYKSNNPYGIFKWNDKQWSYFIKIIKLCRRKKLDLMLVTVPQCPAKMINIEKTEYHYAPINKKIRDIGKRYHLTYIDYNVVNNKKKFVKNSDFFDNNHLNYQGVKKLMNIFMLPLKKELYKSSKKSTKH